MGISFNATVATTTKVFECCKNADLKII